ncbi:MAG: hypothetical protein K0B11_15395 [Mariniphaga sp.]|nr:hypothetical protein [Mariniphaga sp.]
MNKNTIQNPWHFSHLEKNYFRKIANNLRAVNIEYAQIEDLYIGATGVAYIEKKNGRQVNPNWCVRMKNNEEFKFGTPTRNSLESGLWDLSRCNHFKWSDIVKFYS